MDGSNSNCAVASLIAFLNANQVFSTEVRVEGTHLSPPFLTQNTQRPETAFMYKRMSNRRHSSAHAYTSSIRSCLPRSFQRRSVCADTSIVLRRSKHVSPSKRVANAGGENKSCKPATGDTATLSGV